MPTLDEALKQLRSNDPTLTSLNLPSNSLSDAGASALSEALKVNHTLTSLYLSWNNLSAEGARALSEALKVNHTLTSLDLSWNNLSAEGARALSEALKVNQTLTHLYLGNNNISDAGVRALSEVLKVNHTLTSLDLGWNNLSAEGARALSEALKVNQTLTHLNLSGNNISDAGVRALSEVLKVNHTLTILELYGNKISDEGARALSETLKVNQTLISLCLGNNNISDAEASALSEALKVNHRLISLNLYSNKISAEGAHALSEALKVNQTLTHLDLQNNNLSDTLQKEVEALCKRNTQLPQLRDTLFKAIAQGDLAHVKETLKTGISLLAKDNQDNSLLHLALLNKQHEIANYLLAEMTKVPINVLSLVNNDKKTPLVLAIEYLCTQGSEIKSLQVELGALKKTLAEQEAKWSQGLKAVERQEIDFKKRLAKRIAELKASKNALANKTQQLSTVLEEKRKIAVQLQAKEADEKSLQALLAEEKQQNIEKLAKQEAALKRAEEQKKALSEQLEKILEREAKEKYPTPLKSLFDATKPKLLLSALKTGDVATVNSLIQEGIALQGVCLVRFSDALTVKPDVLKERGALVDFDAFKALIEQKLQATEHDSDNRQWLKHYQDSLDGLLEDWRWHKLANQAVSNLLDEDVSQALLVQWRTLNEPLPEAVNTWLEDQLAQSRSAYVEAWKKGTLSDIEQTTLLALLTEALWRAMKNEKSSQFALLPFIETLAEDLKLRDLYTNQLSEGLAKDIQKKVLERLVEGKRRKTLPLALDDVIKEIVRTIVQTEYDDDMTSITPEQLAALPHRGAKGAFEKWQANRLTDSARKELEGIIRDVIKEIQYRGDELVQLRYSYERQAIELLLKDCLANKLAPETTEKVYTEAWHIIDMHLTMVASQSDKPLAEVKGKMEEVAVKALIKHWHQHPLPEAINDALWASRALEPLKHLSLHISDYLAQDKEKRLQALREQHRFRMFKQMPLRSVSEPSVGSSSTLLISTPTPD